MSRTLSQSATYPWSTRQNNTMETGTAHSAKFERRIMPLLDLESPTHSFPDFPPWMNHEDTSGHRKFVYILGRQPRAGHWPWLGTWQWRTKRFDVKCIAGKKEVWSISCTGGRKLLRSYAPCSCWHSIQVQWLHSILFWLKSRKFIFHKLYWQH